MRRRVGAGGKVNLPKTLLTNRSSDGRSPMHIALLTNLLQPLP